MEHLHPLFPFTCLELFVILFACLAIISFLGQWVDKSDEQRYNELEDRINDDNAR